MKNLPYKRFFAFGCSFTRWAWPTWADIIGKEFEVYENWGRGGAGNDFIFNSIVEANQRHKFNNDDLIIVMWSSTHRESRYINDQWIMHPSVHEPNNPFHFAYCPQGYLMRDLALITGAKHLLENVDANFKFTAMYALWHGPNWPNKPFIDNTDLIYKGLDWDHNEIYGSEVLELYKDTLKCFYPSIGEIIFNHDWDSRKTKKIKDKHPTPLEYLE